MLIAEKDHSTVKIDNSIVGWVNEKPGTTSFSKQQKAIAT